MGLTLDEHGRPLGSLRISVTDRCNLRCQYCMPEANYDWIPRSEILSYEELALVAEAFAELGVTKVRLTGGEPLIRRDLPTFVSMLSDMGRFDDIALTTNGVLLADQVSSLTRAGLNRVTVSLDTLNSDRYLRLTGSDQLSAALAGIDAVVEAGVSNLKINMVVIRGVNDDELADMVRFGRQTGAEIRFIEYMDVGGATRWSGDVVVSRQEILGLMETEFGSVVEVSSDKRAPANRFELADGTTFGVIASTTSPFCGQCDRSRITADGQWYTCLYARSGFDLKAPLRRGADMGAMTDLIRARWSGRIDRGAEQRTIDPQRGTFVSVSELRRDPRLEMHARGG